MIFCKKKMNDKNKIEEASIAQNAVCPVCQVKGAKIQVTSTFLGIIPYFEPDGREHYHDRNQRLANLTCLNGHEHSIQIFNTCWCGWKQQ